MKLSAYCTYVFLFSVGLSTACQHNNFNKINPGLIPWKLSASNNQFAIDLLKDISKQSQENLIFSPISIYTILGMLHYGARADTSKELERTLRYDYTGLSKPEATIGFQYILKNHLITVDLAAYVLDIKNTILVNKNVALSSAYKTKVQKYFKARVELADFADGEQEVLEKMYVCVGNDKRGKFCSIVNLIDKSMDIIVANEAYFQSRWASPFSVEKTKQDYFYNAGKTERLVSMMEQKSFIKYYEDQEVSVIQLPFEGKNISMLVVLPHKFTGLADIEKKLSYEMLVAYLQSLKVKFILVNMPKFNMTFYDNFVPNLNRLGAKKIFQPSIANFSGMVPHQEIAVSEVRHKAIIEVNEAGVEAPFPFKTMPLSREFAAHFLANHPFVYFILDRRTGLILFMGHVWNL